MLKMPRTIISDTSCFIILTNIGEFNLLEKIYGKVITTIEFATEFGETLPDWVEIKNAENKLVKELLEFQLDKGEASAIALALEIPDSTIILDDLRARKVAKHHKLKVTGTVGVIVKAKLIGIIPSIKPYLLKISQTDFRISKEIERNALFEAGELEI
jgi:hypothetical protein